MRHKIAHNYFEVDLRIVWDTVKTDPAPVKEWISSILRPGMDEGSYGS
jgi:uncharacterized protein with HEPN domain